MSKRRKDKQMRAIQLDESEFGNALVPNPHRERAPELKLVRGEWRYDASRFVRAVRTHRDDPHGQMYDRKQISEVQYQAGREWQEDYEAAEVGRIKPQDPGRDFVDGGRWITDGITDRHQKAMKRLDYYERLLGKRGQWIVTAVLARKQHINMVARELYGMVSSSNVKMAGWRYRECLDVLAQSMGYAS